MNGWSYGQPPDYLGANNRYMPRQPQQQQGGMGLPSLNPMMFMGENSMFGGAGAESAVSSGGSASGGMSGMAGAATPALFAALIGAGKNIESNNPDSWYGRGLLSMLGPSGNQIKEDRKLGWTTALGLPFLNGFIRNDKAAKADPEWKGLFG